MISSFLGGLYSLIIFVQFIPNIVLNIIKIIVSFILVLIAFGVQNRKQTLKTLVFFYVINFVYAGLMIAIYSFVNPVGMMYENGIVYFNISAVVLCICTIISYLIIQVVSYLLNKNVMKNQIVPIEIEINNSKILLNSFLDTGNQLVDIMTSLPIVMCEIDKVKSVFSKEDYDFIYNKDIEKIKNNYWKKKLKLVLVNTVTGSNMLIGFKADKITYKKEDENIEKQAVIALTCDKISNGEFDALIGLNLL